MLTDESYHQKLARKKSGEGEVSGKTGIYGEAARLSTLSKKCK
jgi:hypothetical protein